MRERPHPRTPVMDAQQTWLDRAISWVSPEAGRSRMRARMQMAVAGAWNGASRSRRALAEYSPHAGSADADLLLDLPTLRARSRDMARNDPLALGAINTVVSSAIGTGLSLKAAVDGDALGLTEEEAAELNDMLEREFRLWAETPDCDASRVQTFYQLQALAFRSELESGDVVALLPMPQLRPGAVYRTVVQLVEADRLCNEKRQADTARLAGGVEMDEYGAAVQYHILKGHPGSVYGQSAEWVKVPAYGKRTGRRNVIHMFERRRPGQTRGYPYLAPVIETLKQLGRYTEAEVSAAVLSSFFTVFVTTETGQGLDVGTDGAGNAAASSSSGGDVKMGQGAIVDLAPGEKVEFADPKRPNTAFDPFVMAVLRQIGVALEIPFEVLIKHFTASYSAARASMLEAWRFFKGRREHVATMFCQPIYEAWLEEAVAIGRVQAPGFFNDPALRRAYCGAEWHGDSPGQLDPTKEVEAAEKRIALNVSNLARETMELTGGDWRANLRQRAKEVRELKVLGLPTSIGQPAAQQQPAPQRNQDRPEGADLPDDDTEGVEQ